ncbi:CAP domain-containing protein [Streptomyces sp. NPDC059918]|uniref:CAP domain-containing protein n=1 Tax=unclassified Streptomyces TaxID=2593676 RepID=UPI003661D844
MPASASEAEAGALSLINIARAEAGCRPLTVSPALAALAGDHSRDMAAAGYAASTSPSRGTVWNRAERAGVEGMAAENIARGPADPQALLNVWTGSPGARANLLNCDYRSTGIGAYFNGSGFWWTEEFAT